MRALPALPARRVGRGPPAPVGRRGGRGRPASSWIAWSSRATTHAGDLHLRLRPILREIAADGLRRRGVDLDTQPQAARALLAPGTWELVRPDRPRPEDPFAPGLRARRCDAVLDDLEALLR